MITNRENDTDNPVGVGQRSQSTSRTSSSRPSRLFVVRFSGESDLRWRAVNAHSPEEARAQALMLSHGDLVDYASVDGESGSIALLGTIGGS